LDYLVLECKGVDLISWIYGRGRTGKTTLAKKLAVPDAVVLDGDDLRHCWKLGKDREDRIEHNMRIAHLAFLLESQGFRVVVATMCPYKHLREAIDQLGEVQWIRIEGGHEPIPGEEY